MTARRDRFHQRIEEKTRDNSAAPVLVVALGDSVTQGCMEEGRMDFDAVYHNRLKQLLEAEHPGATFSVINAGCGGESLPGGLARLDRDVIRHQPDLVVIGYGLNDACGGLEKLGAFKSGLDEIVRRVHDGTEAVLVLLTPNRMASHDNDLVPARWKPDISLFTNTQNNGTLAAFARAVRETAAAHETLLADVYAAWDECEETGADTTLLLCNGINHPNAAMHELTAELIMGQVTS